MRCMQVALLCVQDNSADRPSMLEVDSMLKNEGPAIATPKMPGFSIKKTWRSWGKYISKWIQTFINQWCYNFSAGTKMMV